MTICLSLIVNAADVMVDGVYYNLSINDKVAVVTYRDNTYNSYSGNVVIPSSFSYGGTEYSVTKIGNSAFRDCSDLTSIDIPESVTIIDSYAFKGCNSLTSLNTQNSVTSIGEYAFQGCSGLTSVTIPNSVTYLGEGAFQSCSSMTSLAIGNSLSGIGAHAFQYCSSLTNVTIPNSVTIIREYAFHYCSSLISVTIGSGVKSIADRAFATCPELAVIYCFAKEVPNSPYGSNSDMFNKSQIGKATLYVRTSLIEQYKAKNPWYDFGTITSLDCIDGIYYNFFDNDEAEVTYRDEGYNSYSGDVDIPASVTSVWGTTYTVKSIGDNAFKDCSNQISITIPNSVISIGNAAFENCSGLTSITLPTSLTSIDTDAFRNCSGLTSITIPNSVTSIGNYAFAKCKDLTTVIIQDGLPAIGDYTFKGCTSLNSVTIPSSVISIGVAAFDNCSGLTSIDFPNSVTTIGNVAFRGCSSLTSISISSSVTKINVGAFSYCSSLSDVYCDAEDVPSTHSTAFNNSSIKSATLHIPNKSIHLYKQSAPWSSFESFAGLYGSEYTLSYAIDGSEYKSYIIWEDEKVFPEDAPIKEGYSFSGWSEIPEIMPAHDVTVTGTFSVNSYKLTYVVDGEVYKSTDVKYGSVITPETAPTKEGYTFSGWSEIPETMPAHDVIVTGSFSINNYKLTYMVDDEVYRTYDVEFGATITPETEPTKEGYTFSGWCTIPETMPAHDVTVAGSFSKGQYKLIYIVDDQTYKTISYDYGDAITPEPAPQKDGYSFSGWSEIPETMPAHDVTVTGSFSINKYKLTYMVDDEVYKTLDVEYGATITSETEPTKEGYTFSGWSTIPETMPAHDVTVTGAFTINKYKLTYQVDDEDYKTYDVEFGATITPEVDPAKEGYTFSGWSDIPETMPAHDVTIIGTFSINSYKLTYMVDGEAYKSYDVGFGTTITPEADPAKEGYTFSGWNEIPETMPAHDVTIIGTFSINSYKLTYMVDGEVYRTYDVEFGATITPETEPTKEGYTFSGWSTIPETMPAHDVTVIGSFSKGQYKLIYIVDEQTYKTISYDYDDAITPEPAPQKDGYSFSGWSEIPETMPAHDVTVMGSFSINKYKLTYMVDGEVYKTLDVEYGATITSETEPMKEGYTFSGWSTIPETMPAHNVTATGTFTINKYKLTYEVDGEVYKTFDVEFDATITPETEPTKEGYKFSGWSEIPTTMPAHDVTVTGTFTLDTGIEQIMGSENGNAMIFTIDGKRVNNPKKGLNVIRMKDGTTRKIVVK